MSVWLLMLFIGLAAAIGFAYMAGRIAGLGRGEQDRGDLAEELVHALGTVRRLDQRCERQGAQIRAMTDWEMIDHATPALPGLLRAVPVPRTPPGEDVGRMHRRPDRRPREATRTLAFLEVAPLPAVGESVQDGPGPDPAAVTTSWDQWPVIFAMCASGRKWAASL